MLKALTELNAQSSTCAHTENPISAKHFGHIYDDVFEKTMQSTVFRVEISSHKTAGSSGGNSHNNVQAYSKHFYKGQSLSAHAGTQTAPPHLGMSLYTLQLLGVIPFYKRKLFRMYVDLPVWALDSGTSSAHDDVSLWTLYLTLTSLHTDSKSDAEADSSDVNIPLTLRLSYRTNMQDEAALLGVTLDEVNAPVSTSSSSSSSGTNAQTSATELINERTVAKVYWNAIQRELDTHTGDIAGGK
jgi:hypothetical protein